MLGYNVMQMSRVNRQKGYYRFIFTLFSKSRNIDNFSYFSRKKPHLHGSIYQTEFSKYAKFCKNTSQTHGKIGPKTCQFL